MDGKIGALILAGGRSRRMGGPDKARLRLGTRTFTEKISAELKGFEPLLLSVNNTEAYAELGIPAVVDKYPDCGAMGGILSAFLDSDCGALLTVPCDVPLFSGGLAAYLCSYVSTAYDAYVLRDRAGRIHPLCAVYTRRAAGVMRELVEKQKNYRMRELLLHVAVKLVDLAHSAYPDEQLANVNTPEEYAALRRRFAGPQVIAVSGVKNSGKTTLLAQVIPLLREKGLRVAVIKHDGHDFEPDVPGTDSHRLREAGACGVAVYSDRRSMLVQEKPDVKFEALAAHFHDADVILLEGGKFTSYPKIEVLRGAVRETPVCDVKTLLALYTDTGIHIAGVPSIALGDYESVAQRVLAYLREMA